MKRKTADEKVAARAREMLDRMKPLAVWAFGLNGKTFRSVEKLGGPASFYGWFAGALGELAMLAGEDPRRGWRR